LIHREITPRGLRIVAQSASKKEREALKRRMEPGENSDKVSGQGKRVGSISYEKGTTIGNQKIKGEQGN